jgi:alpha-1,6-mannosyltransferase
MRLRLTFCDIATFYCRTGGGIRTYYDAKLDWFRRQHRHRYVLIIPGTRSSRRALTPSVTLVEARGIGVTRRREGYRLFLDFAHIRSMVRECRPDVLEAGDPWISGPFALWLRRRDGMPRTVSSFFHSDPIPTYVERALSRKVPRWMTHPVSHVSSRAFYRLQASYDMTMVSSTVSLDRLQHEGVTNVWCSPFGVDSALFDAAHQRLPVDRTRRLLYVGRLDRDKQVELLLATLPGLLEIDDVFVTVVGTGRLGAAFDRCRHPRLRCVGYVRDRAALAALYSEHDILLAPGAYETFGLAALEAAAAGLIVVGPDRGGTGALLGEMQSPFVFKAGDAEDFLATVRAALRADWRDGSQASRVLAARYGTWPDAIARLVDTYERVIEAAPCRD